MIRTAWIGAAALLAGSSAAAGAGAAASSAAVEPGQYVYVDGGSAHGQLTLRGSRITLDTIGSNGHTCSLEGTLQGRTGVAKDGDQVCRFSVSGGAGALKLDTSGSDACRDFCGMRAVFDGEYRRAPAACTDRQLRARVEQSHRQYASKQYGDARATTTSLLAECGTFLDWIAKDQARSDLALADYHLGDRAGCVAALSDTIALRVQKGDVVLPPTDEDNYRSTGKAILFNWNLCRTPAPQ